MDVSDTVRQVARAKEMINRLFAASQVSAPGKNRRGLMSMNLEERRERSARMRQYWVKRKLQQSA